MKKILAGAAVLLLLLIIYGVRFASKTPQRLRRSVKVACWLYVVASIVLWLVLREAGDRWWPATILLFGPRWMWILPLIPLAGAAVYFCRRALWILLPALWLVLFPVLGLCIPWRLALPEAGNGPRLRIVTCNLHLQEADTFAAWIATLNPQPDVVAVQEWSLRRPPSALLGQGWHY